MPTQQKPKGTPITQSRLDPKPIAPGVGSTNPSGRAGAGAAKLATEIRERTGQGSKLVAKLLAIVDDPDASHTAVIAAIDRLLDRGWGKAVGITELVDAQGNPIGSVAGSNELRQFSVEELRKMLAAGAQRGGGKGEPHAEPAPRVEPPARA